MGSGISNVVGNLTGGLIGKSDAEKAADEAKKRQEEERKRMEEERKRALEEQRRIAAETASKAEDVRKAEKDKFGSGNSSITDLEVIEEGRVGSVLGMKDEEETLGGK